MRVSTSDCARPGSVSSRSSAAAAAAKAGTPGVTVYATPARFRRRNCSPMALQIERSPEWSRATSSPLAVASTQSAMIASRSSGAVSTIRAPGGQWSSKRARDERAGIEADGRARDEIAPAHGDEIGSARPGADEVHGHRRSVPSETRRRRRSRRRRRAAAQAAVRLRPRRRAPRPRRCWARRSALCAAAEGVRMRSACAFERRERQRRERHAEEARRLDEPWLIGLRGKREHPPLALGRAGFLKRAARQRRDRLARNAGAAADADGDDDSRLAGSWLDEPPLHDRHRRAPAGIAPDRLGMRDRDLRKLPAPARAPVDAARPASRASPR